MVDDISLLSASCEDVGAEQSILGWVWGGGNGMSSHPSAFDAFSFLLCLFCSVLGTALPIPDQSGEEEIDQDIYESLGADEGRRLPGGSSAPPPLPSLPPPRTSLAFFPPPSCPAPPPPIEGITRCGEVKDHIAL